MSNQLSGEFILQDNKTSASKSSRTEKTLHTNHAHSFFPNINKESLHFYSSLCLDPSKVTTHSQLPEEDIHILVRRHHITNIPWFMIIVALIFVPFLLIPLISQVPFVSFSPSTIFIAGSLYYLGLFGYALLKFAEWYFHVGLITNKRLLDIDMLNILSKNVAETQLSAVVDVTYTQTGFLQSVFKYGNVVIQTEAVQQNFEYDKVPHPSQVAEMINQLAQSNKKGNL